MAPGSSEKEKDGQKKAVPKWPYYLLVFDTETTEDLEQRLQFGAYQFCELQGSLYICIEEGLMHPDELDSKSLRILQAYGKQNHLELCSREDFYEEAICPTLRMGGAIGAFNLGFDISRITAPHTSYTCHRDNSGFTFHLAEYQTQSGEWKASVCRPGIERTSIDSKKAFYGIGYLKLKKKGERFGLSQMEIHEYRKGRFLDLRTVAAAALTNRSHSLASLCHTLKAPTEFQKLEYVSGPVSSIAGSCNSRNERKILLGFAVGLGVVVLAAIAGASPPTSPTPRR